MSPINRQGSAVVTLPSDREILITRLFDAPAALVFKAYTTPELVKRWWGFDDSEWLVCEIDLRVGGRWRYVIRQTHEGKQHEVGFHGDYHSVDAPQGLVTTEVYEGLPFPEEETAALDTVRFVEHDGVTTMTILVLHQKPEHRTAHIESGMEWGMQISMDRMEKIIGELSAG